MAVTTGTLRAGDAGRAGDADLPPANDRPGVQCDDEERQDDVRVLGAAILLGMWATLSRSGRQERLQLSRDRLGVVPVDLPLPAAGGADGGGSAHLPGARDRRHGAVHHLAVHPAGACVQRPGRLPVPALHPLSLHDGPHRPAPGRRWIRSGCGLRRRSIIAAAPTHPHHSHDTPYGTATAGAPEHRLQAGPPTRWEAMA